MEYLSDLYAMLRVKWYVRSTSLNIPDDRTDLRFCYDILQDVSRSFALVIVQLHEELRDAVCIFYLVLRALDTIEDDMSIPVDVKLSELPKFHEHLADAAWHITGIGEGGERRLLEQFYCVSREFARLGKAYQDVILDICERMANGMCEFLTRKVETKADYDLYCHYVAGLVGHGLTRLFSRCGFEDVSLADDLGDANHMGLFLQKTNIIRDYFEDIVEVPPRAFWPREIWGQYADELISFRDPSNRVKALECLNAMVADALVHLPFAVRYLSSLRDPSVFSFCAIPQVMAMGTLAMVCNNADTFTTKVKLSKGTTCRIILHANNMQSTMQLMRAHTAKLLQRVGAEDACYENIAELVKAADDAINAQLPPESDGVTRSLLTRYPALGGNLLYTLVDNIVGYIHNK